MRELTVDHRYALSKLRIALLMELAYTPEVTLEGIATKSGIDVQTLLAICAGRGSLSYPDLAKVMVAILGDEVELRITVAAAECKELYPSGDPCPTDAICDDLFTRVPVHKLANLQPKTPKCPKCNGDGQFYRLHIGLMTDLGDYPSYVYYECLACKHTWRDQLKE